MLKIQLEITVIYYILKYTQIEYYIVKMLSLLNFCCTLDQINAGLVSRRDFKT